MVDEKKDGIGGEDLTGKRVEVTPEQVAEIGKELAARPIKKYQTVLGFPTIDEADARKPRGDGPRTFKAHIFDPNAPKGRPEGR